MATIRENQDILKAVIDTLLTLTQNENDETQQEIAASLTSGSDTAISVLLGILAAITAGNTGSAALVTAINTLDANNQTRHLALIDALNTQLGLIDSGITLLNTKAAITNTILQENVVPPLALIYNALLRANQIAVEYACLCADNPALPPPFDTTPVIDTQNHCKRVQAVLDQWIDGICQAVEYMQTGVQVTAAVAATLLGANLIPGIQIASIPASLVGLLMAYIGAMGASRYGLICSWFQDNQEDIVNAVYNSATASEAQQAFYALVDATVNPLFNADTFLTLKTIGWAAVWNAIYDGRDIDTEAYSGTGCGVFNGCQTYASSPTTHSAYTSFRQSVAPVLAGITYYTSVNHAGGVDNSSKADWGFGDMSGVTVKLLAGEVEMYIRSSPPTNTDVFSIVTLTTVNQTYTFSAGQKTFCIHDKASGTGSFSVEVCPGE